MDYEARILTLSDNAVTVQFGETIDPEINLRVQLAYKMINASGIRGIIELVPTYRSLSVYYDPAELSLSALKAEIEPLIKNIKASADERGELIRIPVAYGGKYGEDLSRVAGLNGLSEQEVISIHTEPEYPIYMLGFLPGFCYLGGMDKRIAAPRLATPRVKIAAGSVGIAGSQTGIYPIDSPGGWQIIGRTPKKLYDPNREKPILLEAGMRIKFYSIDEEEFLRISGLEGGDEP